MNGLPFAFGSPWYLLLLVALPLIYWMSRHSLAGLSKARRISSITIRVIVLLLLVLSLAEFRFLKTNERLAVIFVVDLSESIPADRREAERQFVLEKAAEREQNITVGEGDVLLIATGRDARRQAKGSWAPTEGLAGLDGRAVRWLHDRRISMLGSDGVSDAIPNPDTEGWPMPIHQCGIVAIGLHLLDNLRLDTLAHACAERGRWEFFFSIAPLRVVRGTGSPVNPIAIF